MKWASVFVALMGLGAGGIAAWFWFLTSQVETVPTWMREKNPKEPAISNRKIEWIDGLLITLAEAGRLNKRAAIWTACSIVLIAVSTVLNALRGF